MLGCHTPSWIVMTRVVCWGWVVHICGGISSLVPVVRSAAAHIIQRTVLTRSLSEGLVVEWRLRSVSLIRWSRLLVVMSWCPRSLINIRRHDCGGLTRTLHPTTGLSWCHTSNSILSVIWTCWIDWISTSIGVIRCILWYGCKTVIRIHHFIHRSMINVGFVVIILLNPLYTVFKLFAVNNNIEIPSSIRSKLPKNDVFWNTW